MNWASSISTQHDLKAAVREAGAQIRENLAGHESNLVLAFVSSNFAAQYEAVPDLLTAEFPRSCVIGCSAGGVIGHWREIEHAPGLALVAAHLPEVEIRPFHLEDPELPAAIAAEAQISHFLLLPDPFSFDIQSLLGSLDDRFPLSKKIGGLASGGAQAGSNGLFLNGQLFRAGAVGVALSGNIEVDTVVAQGCRPIGNPMFITRCQQNVLYELDGEPCMNMLRQLFEELSPDDQHLAQRSLFLGLVMDETRDAYRQGDFLIRNIIGADPPRQALVIGAVLHPNQVVQFHLRDAKTSGDDLNQLLADYAGAGQASSARGALMFSCLGRGIDLYGKADHDSLAIRKHLPHVALGGFFCNGEIGPVKSTTFLHGYTSSIALFRPRH